MSDIPPPPGLKWDDEPVAAPAPAPAPAAAVGAPPPGLTWDAEAGVGAAPEGFESTYGRRPTLFPLARNKSTGDIDVVQPQIVKDIVDTVMLPGRVFKGETEPTMDDIITAAGVMTPGVASVPGRRVMTEAGAVVPKPVARDLRNDALLPQDVAPKLAELGPRAVIADLGPNLQARAGAVATTPGPGQKTVMDTLKARKETAPAHLRGELDATVGPAGKTPREFEADIDAGYKELGPQYEAVLKDAPPVDEAVVVDLAKTFDETVPKLRGDAQKRLQEVRGMLNKTGGKPQDPAATIANETDPAKRRELVRRHLAGEDVSAGSPLDTDPRVLHEVRKAIDGVVKTTSDTNVQRVLTKARQDIDEVLAQATPAIKEIDAKYQDLARTQENFDVGQTILDSGRTALRPRDLEAVQTAANQPSGNQLGPTTAGRALSQGTRAEIDRIVGTELNDRAALNSMLKGEGDWNYDRLVTLFGKDKTDRLYKVLEDERRLAETENLAFAGSKTGAVQAAQRDTQRSSAPSAPGVLQSAADLKVGTAARRAKDKLFSLGAEKRAAKRDKNIADVIMSKGPLKRDTTGRTVLDTELLGAILRSERGEPDRKREAR